MRVPRRIEKLDMPPFMAHLLNMTLSAVNFPPVCLPTTMPDHELVVVRVALSNVTFLIVNEVSSSPIKSCEISAFAVGNSVSVQRQTCDFVTVAV